MTAPSPLSSADLQFIRDAESFLESPSFLVQLVNRLGGVVENFQKKLPAKASGIVTQATQKALHAALNAAVKSIGEIAPGGDANPARSSARAKLSGRLHLASVTVTGALGGFFGWAALPIELPITTTLMLRSIAQIARSYGADLSRVEDRLECMYILALGTKSDADDATDSVYFASRLGLRGLTRQAAAFVSALPAREVASAAQSGATSPLLRFLASIAARFEITVTEKAMAEALPVLGAVGGAAINAYFMQYFNDAARFHFGIKQLERRYGEEAVREYYREATARRAGTDGGTPKSG
jgi:hypothetical protein